jgi:surface protein
MSGMFSGCAGLTALDLSRFVTGNVNNMNLMFEDCSGLTTLDLSSFVTDQVLWMDGMFAGCTALEELNLSGFTITPWVVPEDGGHEEFSGTSVADMFARDGALCRLTLSPNMGVTEEMRLNNGDAYAGWIVSGDAGCAVVSGDGEYAVIAAPDAVTDYIWNPGRETVPLFTAADAALLLPAALTEIGEEAFAESPAVSVYLQDQVALIGERAFADCTALRAIRIPASVAEIADSAFAGCGSDLVIYGAEDSEALFFAWEHGFLFASEESGVVLRPGL